MSDIKTPEKMANAISRFFKGMRALTDDRYIRYFVTLDEDEKALDLRRADSFKGGFEQYVREKVTGVEKNPYIPG